jgi:hypothetical protein
MDKEFRNDQKRKRDKKSSVGIQVQEKGHFDAAQSVTFYRRKQPQRHPGNQHKRNDAPVQQLNRRSRQPRAQVELI